MATFHLLAGAGTLPEDITVRRIGTADIRRALMRGLDDFKAMPTHLVFLGLIYPLFGVGLGALLFSKNALPLLFPLVSGFALLGPVLAIGLYELSRRRERGLETSFMHVFDVLRSPSMPAIVTVGVLLLVIFVAWLFAAQMLYVSLYGPAAPTSYPDFLREVLTTPRGMSLIILGHAIGFVFAALAFSVGVISIPLLLDRDVGAVCAVQTSVRAVMTNPVPMALWAAVIAGLLVVGSIPLLVGLAVVMPILGHASWHLYRRMIVASEPRNPEPV